MDVTTLPFGQKAYTSDGDDGEFVYEIDTDPSSLTFNQVTAAIRIGENQNGPRGMESGETPLGVRVYAALAESDEVVVIDPATNQIVARVPTGSGSEPRFVRLNPDGTQLWVSLHRADDVLVFETTNYTEIARIPGFDRPADIVFVPELVDTDGDGVDADVEDGAPNGGDGNNDGILDSEQSNVTSLPNFVDGGYVTLTSPEETGFNSVEAVANPSPADAPLGVEFPLGFFEFTVVGLSPGGATMVTLLSAEQVTTYWKYGPTPDDTAPHWYEFLFDGTTGAEILTDRIILHFVDGQRGDDDLTENGQVVEPGAPATRTAVEIDVKPGSDPNSINCTNNHGVIPVAILSSVDFDATTVDHTSVRFGKTGTEASETHTNNKTGEPKRHEEDVDGDNDMDLVFHFRFGDTGLECGDEEAVLIGETFDGLAIEGRDAIDTVGGGANKSLALQEEAEVPEEYALYQNYPNPFNPETEIRFQLPEASFVVLRIFNTLGQEIRRLKDAPYEAGYHSVRWDSKDRHGSAVSSGIYFYHIQAGPFSQTKKMVLIR